MGKTSDEWEGKEEDVFVKQKLQYAAMRTANEQAGGVFLFTVFTLLRFVSCDL